MVMEFERLIDRLKDLGLEDVAEDTNDILEYHRDKLPPHLPGTVVSVRSDDKGELIITQDLLEDPTFTRDILWSVLAPLENSYPKGSIARVYHAIGRSSWSLSGHSMAEILKLSDDELLGIRNFGPRTLSIFRQATQELRDKFVQTQTP